MSGAQEKPLNEYVMTSNAPRIIVHGDEMTRRIALSHSPWKVLDYITSRIN